jgi:hypothetical protein
MAILMSIPTGSFFAEEPFTVVRLNPLAASLGHHSNPLAA